MNTCPEGFFAYEYLAPYVWALASQAIRSALTRWAAASS